MNYELKKAERLNQYAVDITLTVTADLDEYRSLQNLSVQEAITTTLTALGAEDQP